MWQTKYASAVPKKLGMGVDFRLFSDSNFPPGIRSKVINLESDTFGNPIFQKGLQN
jgi:hypothetical protein